MAVIMDNGVLPASKDCAAEVIYEVKFTNMIIMAG